VPAEARDQPRAAAMLCGVTNDMNRPAPAPSQAFTSTQVLAHVLLRLAARARRLHAPGS